MIDDLFAGDAFVPENEDMPATEPEVSNEDYVFADGQLPPSDQLDAFLDEFAISKEEKNCPDEPTPEELEEDETPIDEEAISVQTARNTATFIVSTIDEGASIGLAYLSKDDQDRFRAGKEQKKNLENLFTKFCKEKGTEIPLGWQIFFCLATVYGAKIPYAIDRRKINEELAYIEKQRKELDDERAKINIERNQIHDEWVSLANFKMANKKNGRKPNDIQAD